MRPRLSLHSVTPICRTTTGYSCAVSRILALILLLVSISGCDYALDCLDDDGPVFNRSTLPDPVLNQTYREIVRASIRNEPGDNRFDYDFSLSGRLPAGLSYYQTDRNFIIEGTPIELGRFTFELRVKVDDGYNSYSSGLCFTRRTKAFRFTVLAT